MAMIITHFITTPCKVPTKIVGTKSQVCSVNQSIRCSINQYDGATIRSNPRHVYIDTSISVTDQTQYRSDGTRIFKASYRCFKKKTLARSFADLVTIMIQLTCANATITKSCLRCSSNLQLLVYVVWKCCIKLHLRRR
jgi:hypothetical protein